MKSRLIRNFPDRPIAFRVKILIQQGLNKGMADIFVDFSAANNGNGTAANQAASNGAVGAFNTLASVVNNANDKIWIRRAGTDSWTASYIYTQSGMQFIGWPQAGDEDYSTRPASGISNGWDSDTNTYAQIDSANSGVFFALNGTNQKIKRLRLRNTGGFTFNAVFYMCQSNAGSSNTATNCWFEISYQFVSFIVSIEGQNCVIDGCTVLTNMGFSNPAISCSSFDSTGAIIRNCTILEGTTSTGIGIRFYRNGMAKNCSITLTGAGAKGIDLPFGTNGNYLVRIEDCTISTPSGTGLDGDNFPYQNTVQIRNTSINAKSMSVPQGGGGFSNVRFNQTVPNTGSFGVKVVSGTVCFENANFVSGNNFDFNILEGSLVLVRNCVLQTNPPYNTANRLNPGLYIGDINGNLGFFKSFQESGTIETSSTNRTGGRGFSLKFSPANDAFGNPLLRAGLEGAETIFVPLSAGSRTLTIYGAHKLWGGTPPLDNDIWFECSYVSSLSGATRTVASSRGSGTTLTSDTSVWNGDTGLTLFRMSVSFTVGQNCVAPIRIYLGKYVASAYIYIDPLVSIV